MENKYNQRTLIVPIAVEVQNILDVPLSTGFKSQLREMEV
jgi:hypothetical protein